MLQGIAFPLLKEGPRFSTLREGLLSIAFSLSLWQVSQDSVGQGGLRTLMAPGDGGRTSRVAKAGALVSPALISPPSPLDRRRMRGFSLELSPPKGVNLSEGIESKGKASVAVMIAQSCMAITNTDCRRTV